jgi:hypothetical protein
VESDPRGPALIFARSWQRSKAIQILHIRKLSDQNRAGNTGLE